MLLFLWEDILWVLHLVISGSSCLRLFPQVPPCRGHEKKTGGCFLLMCRTLALGCWEHSVAPGELASQVCLHSLLRIRDLAGRPSEHRALQKQIHKEKQRA